MIPKTDVEQDSLRDGTRIGDWRLYPSLHEIRRDGEVVRLEPKAVALLVRLAERAGRMVSREELLDRVWPGVVVGDDSLTQVVIKLRKALGDQPRHPDYIQTIPKQGYRLIAAVEAPASGPDGAAPGAPHPRRAGTALVAGGVILAVLLLGYLALPGNREAEVATGGGADAAGAASAIGEEPLTIAVLPFEPLREGAEQNNLARGITADLVTDLSRLSGLWVISTHSVFGHDDGEGAAAAASARYYVSGSVQRTPGRLEAHIRLIDSGSGRQLWSERFDRPIGDLFDVQAEISRQVVRILEVRLTRAEHWRLAQRYTRNLEAYELFLQGQAALLVRQERENLNARRLYQRAIELDPTFARAYAGLALSYVADYRNQWGEDGEAALARASEMAQTALEIDPGIPEVYWVLGYIETQRRHHGQAIAHLETALGLDQSFADAYALMGGINTYDGHPHRTVKLIRQAMRLNPEAGYLYFLLLGRAYFFIDDPEQAMINLREALARNPANLEAHVYLAAAATARDDVETGEWEVDEILALQPGFDTEAWLATYPMTDAGQIRKLSAALASLGL
ncbi:winged helix-turn-helix domain-containing protein [Thioalbus denitrificans]|uniref:DNA-binding winged helix-turn-helix (WHTH) protein n=1 Tax=Thioalbus denitrificans TaxID=547122 RepID=A0A369BZZ5_9GAMM|nr:winged helix-turn-helix domain-containing protein [Thioalbus denitrificans]RCX26515.1 DNA-binding winged helix-turn-helix (wHTH) protein [Thioalbus denitrificans]